VGSANRPLPPTPANPSPQTRHNGQLRQDPSASGCGGCGCVEEGAQRVRKAGRARSPHRGVTSFSCVCCVFYRLFARVGEGNAHASTNYAIACNRTHAHTLSPTTCPPSPPKQTQPARPRPPAARCLASARAALAARPTRARTSPPLMLRVTLPRRTTRFVSAREGDDFWGLLRCRWLDCLLGLFLAKLSPPPCFASRIRGGAAAVCPHARPRSWQRDAGRRG
jgi:hypothetical protein